MFFGQTFPAIDLEKLSAEKQDFGLFQASDRDFAAQCIATRGKNKGKLRASKPNLKQYVIETGGRKFRESDPFAGSAAYVWRIVAFMASPLGQHHCMPVMAEFDLPYFIWDKDSRMDNRRELINKLKPVIDHIVDAINTNELHGVKRWARCF